MHPTRPAPIFVLALILMAHLLAGGKNREGTEWDTAYWYNANDSKLPRVLLLGDSICNGYQTLVRDEMAGVAYVSFWATSKCVTDRSYLKQLAYILEEYQYTAVHFNNGLHSLGNDPAEWEAGLRAALALIRQKAKGAKIIWASSTPLKDPALTEKAKILNAVALKVMSEEKIPIDDLFALMDPQDRAKFWTDTYHYNTDGKRMQAKQVAEHLRSALGGKTATLEEARSALASAASETGPDGKLVTLKKPEPTGAGPNLLPNGDFESTGGWAVYPNKPEAGNFSVSPDGAHSGKQGAKIVSVTPLQLVAYRPPLAPSTTYQFKFWARCEAAAKLSANLRTQKPPYKTYGDTTVEVGPVWKEYRCDLVTPEGYKGDEHVLLFYIPAGATWFLDDVAIEKK